MAHNVHLVSINLSCLKKELYFADDYCKKEVNVTLHAEDLRMLKGEVYIAQKEPFSFACLVRKFRRKELNQNVRKKNSCV